jgi:hypothetical protein
MQSSVCARAGAAWAPAPCFKRRAASRRLQLHPQSDGEVAADRIVALGKAAEGADRAVRAEEGDRRRLAVEQVLDIEEDLSRTLSAETDVPAEVEVGVGDCLGARRRDDLRRIAGEGSGGCASAR